MDFTGNGVIWREEAEPTGLEQKGSVQSLQARPTSEGIWT